ncbi:hypothetical protein PoB_002526000 [Plakobranchus ocellatus]|uniref:Uncharacterized protein n=1 Tax=Plakobranchus ocellatus TaxID=259542 RepID=A0AAV3ZVU6_9GAST|nr:hypothetical protein PoB_002526000 [Plakobranchus ocellatus]
MDSLVPGASVSGPYPHVSVSFTPISQRLSSVILPIVAARPLTLLGTRLCASATPSSSRLIVSAGRTSRRQALRRQTPRSKYSHVSEGMRRGVTVHGAQNSFKEKK